MHRQKLSKYMVALMEVLWDEDTENHVMWGPILEDVVLGSLVPTSAPSPLSYHIMLLIPLLGFLLSVQQEYIQLWERGIDSMRRLPKIVCVL